MQIEGTVICQCNQQNQESQFFVDLPRNRISTLERDLFEENAIIEFLLIERSKPVRYKKENEKILIDTDQEHEEETKPQKFARKKIETLGGSNNKKETFWSLVILC